MKNLVLTLLVSSATFISFGYKNVGSHAPGGGGSGDPNSRAANCAPANERLFMEFNNVKALVETGGSLWQDRANGNASYEVPANSNKFVIYSGALWMGGEDVNGQLKLAAHMFRQGNDFWAGPLGDLIENSGNYVQGVIQTSEFTLVRDHGAAEIIPSECLKYDQFYTIRKIEVRQYVTWWNCENGISAAEDCQDVIRPTDDVIDRITNWPAHGDPSLGQDFYLAPFYDADGNGFYNPVEGGDYPWYDINDEIDCRNDRRVTLFGDETHWWVFNDKGNIHTESGGDPIGMEVRAQAFAFATDDAINDMTFYNYELINRGTQTLFNTYFGQWVDSDIGQANNDYVGCDVSRGLGFGFNGQSVDNGQGGQAPYGASPPAIGVDFFEGPYKDNDSKDNPLTTNIALAIAEEGIPYAGLGIGYGDGIVDNERLGMNRFVYYDIGAGQKGDPSNATDFYGYLRGVWKNGNPFLYGGDGFAAGTTTIPTKYCFPGDSDPLHWGTLGVDPGGATWSEVEANNPPGDRRFLQSAGPFTLLPGAVNNITVGVVYGRNTSETDLEASVRSMKTADSKAQALFDNCFELVEPPVAPDLTIQEMENQLILFLTNPPGIDVEAYKEVDKINIPQNMGYDDTFRFEGYQIFQMINSEATVGDLNDNEKARLVAQCDVENGVSKLVNYTYDEELDITIPSVMVDGDDEGVRHSFLITQDLFASGATNLVNHKKYYYIAVAYGYNNYKTYDPLDPLQLDGQKNPYLRSRISGAGSGITSVVGIPHDPTPEADGTNFSTLYGYQPEITQIEGTGNGGQFVKLTDATISTILASNTIDHPTYQAGFGPIGVKVVDPLNLAGGDYTLGFDKTASSINAGNWWMTRSYTDDTGAHVDTVKSAYVVGYRNEQLILDWGLSVSINQQFYEGSGACQNLFTDPIGATLTYADSSKAWLTGVKDDDANYPTNWIRSGTATKGATFDGTNCIADEWIYGECNYYDLDDIDPDQKYEKLLEGTIAPFNRVGFGTYGLPLGFPGENNTTHWYSGGSIAGSGNQSWFSGGISSVLQKACFPNLHDVDIVITQDQTKWTRCPVIEINDNETQTFENEDILHLRKSPSVGKNGLPDGTGTGMGWFPGYAVDVTTGKRLNMAFSENTWLLGENGADMIWNPTSRERDQTNIPLFGGMHYVYVFGVDVDNSGSPAYDEGAWLRSMWSDVTSAARVTNFRNAWKSCQWVWEPMLIENTELLATDAEINLRINRPYETNVVGNENLGRPLYTFKIDNPTTTVQADKLESVLDRINVVPNPYYAYSSYETSKLDNRVKIVNLPERCTVSIFNMQGALVRSFEKDDPLTSIDWDLKNQVNVPIAGGLYIIHVKIPVTDATGNITEQERIIKWYGALRPPDLDNL